MTQEFIDIGNKLIHEYIGLTTPTYKFHKTYFIVNFLIDFVSKDAFVDIQFSGGNCSVEISKDFDFKTQAHGTPTEAMFKAAVAYLEWKNQQDDTKRK